MNEMELAAEIAARVGCYGVGAWLKNLAQHLSIESQELMPIPVVDSKIALISNKGLRLTLHHPHAGHVDNGDIDRWVLTDAEFGFAGQFGGNWTLPAPFGIDPATCTPLLVSETFGDLLSGVTPNNLSRQSLQQTYFLKDDRAVGMTWKSTSIGIESIHVVRLGMYVQYGKE
jgi:hypothetical protein